MPSERPAPARPSDADAWTDTPYAAWADTCSTLQLWTQIVGKIRLARTPWVNHSWHVPLYVGASGLTTSPIPDGGRVFEIAFDFLDHRLTMDTSDGGRTSVALRPRSVADFHAAVMAALRSLGIEVVIDELPCEIPGAIRFSRDEVHGAYDADYVGRFFRALVQADRLLKHFRSGFIGKISPVHFFWGSFDLAVTRFSGRSAPRFSGHVPGVADAVMREAYSEEVCSAGFWPGGGGFDRAAFYSYAYPEPAAYKTAAVRPAEAAYHDGLGQFLLPYDAARAARDPDAAVLDFLQTTYEAAADSGGWNRASLDCAPGRPGVPRPVA